MSDRGDETTPLLRQEDNVQGDDPHGTLFNKLDANYRRTDNDSHPHAARKRTIHRHLQHATHPAGHGHPIHHHMQSQSLILRLEQCLEHGFSNVIGTMRQFFKTQAAAVRGIEGNSSAFPTVLTVFVIAVLTMLTMTAISPTLLLYMNHVGFTSSENITAYVMAAALSSAVPIVSNIVLGYVGTRFGPGRALSIGALASALGLMMVLLSRQSELLFFLGYGLYSASGSLRVIRVSILATVVPQKERTTILATHSLMTPIGALLGPLVWIVMQTYRGSVPLLGGIASLDRFSFMYVFASMCMLWIAVIAAARLATVGSTEGVQGRLDDMEDSAEGENTEEEGDGRRVTLRFADGAEEVVDLQRFKMRVFWYFCGIMFGVNMSAAVYMTAFQPVLVNVFNVSDGKIGGIFEVIAVFAVLPPLLVALLSRRLMDRQIMVIGLVSKLVGMTLFLPLFGKVHEWQVIIGFLLILKASIFFSTASMSLLTKILGPMTTSTTLGLLASASSIGPALAQVALSGHIVALFGGFGFAVFAVPAAVSLAMVLYPWYWRRLNPDREFNHLLAEAQETA